MTWFADCSLIRTEPYIINIASWDGACRNPQDSARHTFKIYILPNPDLFPSFTLGKDTVIELVAGEKFELELNSKSVLPGDSILIGTTGVTSISSFRRWSFRNFRFERFISSCNYS